MAPSHLRLLSCTGLVTVLLLGTPRLALAQAAPSVADGPWSGQAQCVLTTRDRGYEDEQIQTWRITAAPPTGTGASRLWPAIWSVQGRGRRTGAAAGSGTDTWEIDTAVDTTIAISELPGNQLRIGSQHAQLVVSGGVNVTTASGQRLGATVAEWQFPTAEDVTASITLSGTSTRELSVGPGWQRPFSAVTTATCTWNFTRGGSIESGLDPPPVGGRGRVAVVPSTGAPDSATQPAASSAGTEPLPNTQTPTGAGDPSGVPQPRAIATVGFVGVGTFVPEVPVPRTIAITGWTARGQ